MNRVRDHFGVFAAVSVQLCAMSDTLQRQLKQDPFVSVMVRLKSFHKCGNEYGNNTFFLIPGHFKNCLKLTLLGQILDVLTHTRGGS